MFSSAVGRLAVMLSVPFRGGATLWHSRARCIWSVRDLHRASAGLREVDRASHGRARPGARGRELMLDSSAAAEGFGGTFGFDEALTRRARCGSL